MRGADNARSATHLRLRFPDDINLVSLLGASDCSKYVGYLRSSFNLPGKDNVGRSSGARRWGNAIAVIPCDARATYYDTLSPHTAFRSTLRRYMRSTSVLAVRPVSPPSHCFPPERLNFPIYYWKFLFFLIITKRVGGFLSITDICFDMFLYKIYIVFFFQCSVKTALLAVSGWVVCRERIDKYFDRSKVEQPGNVK